MKNERTTIIATGVVVGIIASMLVYFGNPANIAATVPVSAVSGSWPLSASSRPPVKFCSVASKRSEAKR